MVETTLQDYITTIAAAIGAALGMYNFYQIYDDKKVKLRVTPAHAISANHRFNFSIEILNLSNFPVEIAEYGFSERRLLGNNRRIVMMDVATLDNGPWPRTLDRRQRVAGYLNTNELKGTGLKLMSAYVRTSCGEIVFGTSGALRQVLAER